MNSERELTRVVRSWLEDGVTVLPDRVLNDVLAELPVTPQRRVTWWPARRVIDLNTNFGFLGAAAAILVIVVVGAIGIGLLRSPSVAGPGGTPSPTVAPTSNPSATAAPTATTTTATDLAQYVGSYSGPGNEQLLRIYDQDDPVCIGIQVESICWTLGPTQNPRGGAAGSAAMQDGLLALLNTRCPNCLPEEVGATNFFEPRNDGTVLHGIRCEPEGVSCPDAGVPYIRVGSASPSAAPSTSPGAPIALVPGADTPGRYTFGVGPENKSDGRYFEIELDLPEGWSAGEMSSARADIGGPDQYLGFFAVQRVYQDPCHPELGYQGDFGLTAANAQDVVDELMSLTGFTAGETVATTIDDLPTTHFSLSNDIDAEAAGCTDGNLLPLFATLDADTEAELSRRSHSPATNGGSTEWIWLVDRDNFPLLIVGEFGPDETAGREAIEEILGSITLH